MIAWDTETTGLDLHHGCKPFFISAVDEDCNLTWWEWDVDPLTREPVIPAKDIRDVTRFLNREPSVLHNLKFDIRAVETIGVRFDRWEDAEDTCVASHCLASSEPHGLKSLALRHLDMTDDDQQELKDAINEARRMARSKYKDWRIAGPGDPHFPSLRRAPKAGWGVMDMWLPRAIAKAEGYPEDHPWWTVCQRYALNDAERTMGLWWVLSSGLKEEGLWDHYRTRMQVLRPLYEMERQGITYSLPRYQSALTKFSQEADQSAYRARKYADSKIDNLDSPKQLQGVLYGHFGLKPVKSTKNGYSTDAETLQSLLEDLRPTSKSARFIQNLVKSRKNRKAVDYLEAYRLSGLPAVPGFAKLHPTFNLTGSEQREMPMATTRASSQDPNAQNISKQEAFNLRQIFGPAPGRVWWSMDYENIELRIFAYASGDKELIQAFEAGYSVHLLVAEELYPQQFRQCEKDGVPFNKRYKSTLYQWIKNGNFSLIYGASARKADATYRFPGAYGRIRKRFKPIDRFMEAKFTEGRRKGFVECLGGYRLQVPKDRPHVAVNYFVQGSAGWAMNLAIIRCHEYLRSRPDYHIIMTIHDELDFDFPQRSPKTVPRTCKRLMERSGQDLSLPLPVDAGRIDTHWAEEVAVAL